MVWKEPGKDKDPWNSAERPPDLERMVKSLQQRLGRLFRRKPGRRPHKLRVAALWWLVPVIIAAWLLSGFYKVAPGDRGVAFIFGRYQAAAQPGLHWHLPWPIGHSVLIAGVEGRDYTHTYTNLVTSDGKLLVVDASVRYHVTDLRDYLFNTSTDLATPTTPGAGAAALVGQLANAVIRSAVAQSSMAALMGSGRGPVEAGADAQLNALLKPYNAGVEVTRVALQRVSLPDAVANSDADVQGAEQKAGQQTDAAHAYAGRILAEAQVQADAEERAAQDYRTTLVGQAQADTARFNAVLAAYRKAPEVTREELYLQTMQSILADANKVVVDTRDGRVTVQLGQPFERAPALSSSARAAGKSMAPHAASTAGQTQAAPTAISGGAHL